MEIPGRGEARPRPEGHQAEPQGDGDSRRPARRERAKHSTQRLVRSRERGVSQFRLIEAGQPRITAVGTHGLGEEDEESLILIEQAMQGAQTLNRSTVRPLRGLWRKRQGHAHGAQALRDASLPSSETTPQQRGQTGRFFATNGCTRARSPQRTP